MHLPRPCQTLWLSPPIPRVVASSQSPREREERASQPPGTTLSPAQLQLCLGDSTLGPLVTCGWPAWMGGHLQADRVKPKGAPPGTPVPQEWADTHDIHRVQQAQLSHCLSPMSFASLTGEARGGTLVLMSWCGGTF